MKDIKEDINIWEVTYRGLRIEPTLSANRELVREGKDLYDVLEILESGYIVKKRKKDIIEKALRKGNKEFRAVIAKTQIQYPDGFIEYVWRLIHFGKIAYKKKR